jgi:hypothetical protein
MSGPHVSDEDFTERTGVIEVSRVVNAARCIWRETPLRDVGIDGQIEYVRQGRAAGRLVGVQVKSGRSYFLGEKLGYVPYRVPEKHAEYWSSFALPVILVLHDPDRDLTVWTDARAALRRGENPVLVPTSNALDAEGVLRAIGATGPLPADNSDLHAVLAAMVASQRRDPGFYLSYLDLFCQGMTDIAYSLYFNMDLVDEVAEANAAHIGWAGGLGIGFPEFEWIDRYIAFLVAHDLARVDYDAWHQAAVERQMTASFIAPLTATGRALVALIVELETQLLGEPQDSGRAIEERPVRIIPLRMAERAARIQALKEALPDVPSDGSPERSGPAA